MHRIAGLTLPLVLAFAAAISLPGGAARAGGERAGSFDYYVLSLSWSANWCVLEGDARRDDQCDARHDHSFTLHGLWPQFQSGYPSYCRTSARDPSRAESAGMADIMGSGGLAWYQWKKHGRCTGLAPEVYFATARRAYASVTLPPVFAQLHKTVRLPALVVEQAFLEVNPGLRADMVTVTCERGMIQEVRICLDKDLQPRSCGADVARDCRMPDAVMEPVR